MNHCYRLVFNAALHIWQAVAETAKSHTKSRGKSAAVVLLPVLMLGISSARANPAPNALPSGALVVSGQSTISQNGNQLNILQSTQKSIINWASFNIGANGTVNYTQPNSSAISLNRVIGQDPSAIFGKLNAKGQVWLINPSGILFGQSAQVNVGGLLASTLNIADDDFLNSNYQFTGSTGSVVNMGSIVVNNGSYVAMLAPEVRNEGIITALQGASVLAAGDATTLDFNGNNLINVQVDSANINTLIENKNLIKVGNGQVIMSSKAADGLITSVINNSGRIEADSMVSDGGVVRLTGAKTVINSGEISAQSSAGKGGIVHMLGETVAVMDAGSIYANGKTGGGTILIGGDLQGNNANIQNAQKTFISQNAQLSADATHTGNGGKVIVWADDITRYYGSISAKGGVNGGNGGFAEVSGNRLLNFLGGADLSAANGVGGNLLIDPLNITLTTADANTAGFTVPGDLTEAFADDSGLTSTFNVSAGGSFSGIAANSTITLQATNDINVNSAFNVATATGSANNSLVLQANNNINVNAAITTTGNGLIRLNANQDGVGGGNLAIAATVSAQSGGVTLSGVDITRTAGDITSIGASGSNGGNIDMTATGAITLGGATVSNNGGGLVAVGGNAGNINISASTGFSMAGAIISGGPASLGANTAGGNGGNVSISSATGNVSTGAITTNGGNAGAGIANGSNAGNISVVAAAGNVTTGALTARTGLAAGTGASGAVANVSASGVNVTLAAVDTSGQALSNGNGGSITANATGILTLNGAVNSSGGTVITGNAGKNAGAINLTAGSITSVAAGTITANGSNGLGLNQAGGNGVAVSLTATGNISARAISANGGNGVATNAAGGNAGSINIATNTGNITTNTGALTARTGAGIGTGANSTPGFISVNNTSAAGTITLGALSTAGNTNGHGGNIAVAGSGAVTLASTVNSSGGVSTGTRAGRNAGSVTITGANRSITGAITASGAAGIGLNQAGGNAGAVSITGAGTLNTAAAITASTGARTGAGAGGVAGSIALSGTSITSAALSTVAGAGGVGGNVNVTTTGATTSSIASINANTNGAINMSVADTLTVTGAIAGTGTTLTKTGAGAVILAGANAYTGATTVAAGQLQIGNGALAGSIVNTGGIVNNGTVIFNRSDAHNYGGVISGTGVMVKDGAGVFTLSGANTYTGATNILAGTLQDSASIPNSSAVNVSLGATLNLNNQNEIVGSIAGAGNIIMGTAALTSGANNSSTNFSGVISGVDGNFNKAGSGTLLLSGINTYTGLTQVQAGTLSAANANALGTSAGGTTVSNLATLNVNNVTLAETAITLNTGGAITGTDSAALSGTLASATNSSIGTTTAASTLTLNGVVTAVGNLGIVGAGDVTAMNAANNFATVNINGAKNVSLQDANAITIGNGVSSLTGNLTVQAGGDVTINNNITSTGGDITLAGVNFINNAGASALTTSGLGKRWLVYVNTHTGNTFNLLNSGNQAIWNTAYPSTVSQIGNRYVFANSPTLTVTSTDQVKTYGQDGAPIVSNAYTVTGLVNAATFGNVFTQDTAANTVIGNATSTGSPTTTNVGSYAIDVTPVSATTGYTLTKNSTGNLTVNQAALTVTANNQTKTYGNTFTFSSTEFTNSALQNGETIGSVNLASAGAVNTANVVGSPYAISANTATGGTFNANNYAINYVAGAMTVNPATLNLSGTRTYNGTTAFNPADFGTINGVLGQTLNLTGVGSVVSANAGAAQTLTLASLALSNGTGLASNYTLAGGTHTGTVNQADITVSTTDAVKTYDGSLTALGTANVTSGSLFNNASNGGAADSLSGGTFGFTNANAGAGNKTVTVGGVTVNDGNSGGNYNVTFANNTTSTINKANLTISTSDVIKTYDATTTAAGIANVTSGTLFNNASNGNVLDNLSGGSFAFTDKNFGIGNKTVTVAGVTLNDGNSGGNYNVTFADNSTSTINKAALSLNAVTDTKTYDGNTTSAGLASSIGLFAGDNVTGLTQSFASKNVANNSVLSINAGFSVNDGNGGNNYLVTTNNAAGTITPRAITVTAATDTKIYDANTSSAGAPTITTGSIASGDSATFSQTFDNKNAGTGKTLTATGTLTDGNSGNNYAVTFVNDNTGIINQLGIIGGITANNKIYDATTAATIATRSLTGVIAGDTVNYTGGSATFNNKNVGTGKTVTGTGLGLTGADAGNYSVNTTAVTTADISKADISAVIGITGNNKVYDATTVASFNTGAATYTGMIGGDLLTIATAAGAFVDANAATGITVNITGISLGGADSGNYNLLSTTASTTADINKAALSVTANNATKIQGSTNPAFSSVISGFVGDETIAALIGVLGHNTPAVTSSPAGNYTITPFGLSAANYNITFVDGVLLVNAPTSLAALGVNFNAALTRPEQAQQTCGDDSAGSAMISGLDAFGVDDVEYKKSVSQPQIGGVVANALVSPSCTKL